MPYLRVWQGGSSRLRREPPLGAGKVPGAYFPGKEVFHNRRSDPGVIAKALDLYFRGTSLRRIADHFAQTYGLRAPYTTIYRWIVH